MHLVLMSFQVMTLNVTFMLNNAFSDFVAAGEHIVFHKHIYIVHEVNQSIGVICSH